MLYTENLFIPKYVQARNITKEMKRILFPLGSRIAFMMGCGPIAKEMEEKIRWSFDNTCEDALQDKSPYAMGRTLPLAKAYDSMNKSFELHFEDVEALPISQAAIEKTYESIKDFKPDVLVAVGGGKTLDLTRGLWEKFRCAIALMPTAVATNAPCTRFAIIYKDDGSGVDRVGAMPRMHDMVIIDPEVTINSPAINVSLGIGDCVATYYESLYNGTLTFALRNKGSQAGWALLENSGKVLLEHGIKAYNAAKEHRITLDYEKCIEAMAFTNGMGSSSVGTVGMAHVYDELLVQFESARKYRHGHHVGYATIPTMIYFQVPLKEIHDYIDFAMALDIPVSLKDFGLDKTSDEELLKAAEIAVDGATTRYSMEKFPPQVLVDYLHVAENLVQEYLASK